MSAQPQTNRKYDRIFFPILTLLILITVFIGFARTYYMAGMVNAPLPNVLIHIHGAVFSCWLILLTMQTGFVTAKRVDLHKKLGLFGFGLSIAMVVLGLLAATDALRRGMSPPDFPLGATTFYVVPLTAILLFSILIYNAYRTRTNPAVHKRLIMIATIAILGAAIGRWPFAFVHRNHFIPDLCEYVFFLLLGVYDLASTGRVQKVTIWASALVIVVEQVRIPLAMTGAWQAFAHFMQRL